MKSLTIPNNTFFANVIQEINSGNSAKIPVKGNSMLPFIRQATDEIGLSPLNEKSLGKGNIVLAQTSENKYIVHRIEKVEQHTVTLRGDGNLSTREICDKNSIFAEVTVVYRNNRKITKNSFRWNLAKRCWFSHPFLRRVYLGIYRRIGRIANK